MDLLSKIRTIPTQPGVYLYKNAEGEVIYVGKAKNLRARVRSYFQEGVGEANAKTGSLLREAVDVEYIVVDNNVFNVHRFAQQASRFGIGFAYAFLKIGPHTGPQVLGLAYVNDLAFG